MKQIHKFKILNIKWPWQILVVIIYIFLLQPAYGIGTNLWLSFLWGGILYAIYTFYFDERFFPRNRKNDRIMIPIVVWILIEFIADGVYAFAHHSPFFLSSLRKIIGLACRAGVLEELLFTFVFITLMVSVTKSRKQQLTKKHLIIIVFIAATVFGVMHITNWTNLLSYYQDEPPIIIAIRIFVHVVNAFSFGLITKVIFIKTGSLLYCMLVHVATDISRIGTALTNDSLLALSIIVIIFMVYGVYSILHIDESVVDFWNKG